MKTKTPLYIGLLFILTGCALLNPDLRYEPKTSDEYYFPSLSEKFNKAQSDCIAQKKFPCDFSKPNDSLSDNVNSWYSKHLNSLKEPIIYNQTNKGLKIIRFTHLGTWSNPKSFRIENKNGDITGTYNRTKGLGGYQAGRRVEHEQKKLSQSNWNRIVSEIESGGYWSIDTHDPNMILEGEEWILEVLIEDKYHVVTRNSPDVYDRKDYADLCKLVVDLCKE